MEKYIEEIIKLRLPLFVGSTEEISGGVVGHVFRLQKQNEVILILKFNKNENTDVKSNDEFVYGSDPQQFGESYKILKTNRIPVPEIFAQGITNDQKFSYILMQDLGGDKDDYSLEWFGEVGHWLGKLHAIKKTYDDSWLQCFKESLNSRFQNVKELLDEQLSEKIEHYIKEHVENLWPAETFCFSHLDGFQGILKKEARSWKLLGVVDIEDHCYTDQRFVLAGFELNNQMKGNIVPEIFWSEYQKHVSIDPLIESTKNLFRIYYLLVWSFVLKNDEEKLVENISFLRSIVGKD